MAVFNALNFANPLNVLPKVVDVVLQTAFFTKPNEKEWYNQTECIFLNRQVLLNFYPEAKRAEITKMLFILVGDCIKKTLGGV